MGPASSAPAPFRATALTGEAAARTAFAGPEVDCSAFRRTRFHVSDALARKVQSTEGGRFGK